MRISRNKNEGINEWKITNWCLLMSLIFFSSCYAPGNYLVTRPKIGKYGTHVVMALSSKHSFIVIQKGDSAWQLVNYNLSRENSSITGLLMPLPTQKVVYKIYDPVSNDTTIQGNTDPFKEIHVRVSKLEMDSAGYVTILKEDIKEIKDYNKDYRTKKEFKIAIAIAGGAIVTSVIIRFMTMFFQGLNSMDFT